MRERHRRIHQAYEKFVEYLFVCLLLFLGYHYYFELDLDFTCNYRKHLSSHGLQLFQNY